MCGHGGQVVTVSGQFQLLGEATDVMGLYPDLPQNMATRSLSSAKDAHGVSAQ